LFPISLEDNKQYGINIDKVNKFNETTLILSNTAQVYVVQIVPSHVCYMFQPVLRPF